MLIFILCVNVLVMVPVIWILFALGAQYTGWNDLKGVFYALIALLLCVIYNIVHLI